MKKTIFLLSSSSVHGHGFLEFNREDIRTFFAGLSTPLLFVPFAAGRVEWDNYTAKVADFFKTIDIPVTGIHTVDDNKIFSEYKAIFIGGGNTFRLLRELQQRNLLTRIRKAVQVDGMLYMGSSAGTNMATCSIRTTNDMPIVYPDGGFDAINLFPWQINPHYLDPDPSSKHMGETREQRIAEFHQENDTPVFGLREGSYISIAPDVRETREIFIGGEPGARIFLKGRPPYEAPTAAPFTFEQ
ncbi:MAG: dipeptidase PepE [Taibaiella sp.]|nr:dipeptidase PepE [Taibaiella sp.]